MKRRGVAEGYLKVERGHTAREAYDRSGLRPEYGFNELSFELVQDEAPPLATEPAPVSPAIVRKVRRRLRAQGVSA
jgi:major membrane immunogen (membrane-anchored lipoprotein)